MDYTMGCVSLIWGFLELNIVGNITNALVMSVTFSILDVCNYCKQCIVSVIIT